MVSSPLTLRRDGSLLCSPGYDEETGLLLRGSGWPEIPDHPSESDVAVAFDILWHPFAKFPFVTKEDRAVMLAAILTGIVRRSLPRAPAFSFDAPVAGTGKTLLGLCLLRLCGSPPTVIPQCREEEELRKRLLAMLREGKPGILFDNIRGQFGSAALEAFLTSESYSDRVLGFSQTLTFPTNILLMISGNNFQPKGDLYRRILTARIDARTDNPERRSFDLKPDEYCSLHRQEIVAAGLTLLRGFVAAGKLRISPDRLASFEDWDDLVRQAVLWFGQRSRLEIGDPTSCIETAKQQEPERQKLAAFLAAVFDARGERPWRVGELLELAALNPLNTQALTAEDKVIAALKLALEEVADDRGNINARILGRWIERQKDSRCAGLYLTPAGTKQRARVWKLARDSFEQ